MMWGSLSLLHYITMVKLMLLFGVVVSFEKLPICCSEVDMTCPAGHVITGAGCDIAAWKRNGFIDGVDIVSEKEMDVIRMKVDEIEKSQPGEKFPSQLSSLHFKHRFLAELAIHPHIVQNMKSILGPDLVLLSTTIFTKYPQTMKGPSYVGYHQDMKYFGIEPLITATAWVALDPANSSTGSMQFLPGSHRRGLVEHGRASQQGNILHDNQDIGLDEEEKKSLVQSHLEPGQASIHDGLLVHGSPPNCGLQRRSGLTAIYTTPEVILNKMVYENEYETDFREPVLVTGQDSFGRIRYVKTLEEMLQDAK